jgi:excisionase family DNA binding protein
MRAIPKPKNFRIGLMAGAGMVDEVDATETKASLPKPKKAVTSDDQYVTVKEAADILKCSEKTIRNYYGDGRLKYKKIGQRKVLILRSSVDALLGE